MRLRRWLTAMVIGGATGLASAQPTAPIDQLAWLAGCWAGERQPGRHGEAPRRIEAQWMAPRAGSMLGMARTLRGQRLGIDFSMRRVACPGR